jgi:hypothetical protein
MDCSVIKPQPATNKATKTMNTERDLRIASKSNAVPVGRWWRTFCGLSHRACYTVFDGAVQPLILLDFFRARIFFNPLLYRLSYRARGGIVTGKTAVSGSCCDPLRAPAMRTAGRLLHREQAPAKFAAHRPHTKTGLVAQIGVEKLRLRFDTHRS